MNTHGQDDDVWARLVAAEEGMEMVQSNSEDEGVDCRDSLVSFVSPIAAPMGAEIWAAQHVHRTHQHRNWRREPTKFVEPQPL